MDENDRSSVLVCITAQSSCDRLIKIGWEYAEAYNCQLHILMVHPPLSDYCELSSELEYLYLTTKQYGGEMTILFEEDAPSAAAEFAEKINAKRIVTGMPDGRLNGFIIRFHEALPLMPISMVSENNTVYNMERERTAV